MRTEGSTDRPYQENPPERLREVHWGWAGGRFVSGATRYSDIDTVIRYLEMRARTDIPRWENLGVGAFGTSGEVMGAAVGAGAAVLVGAANSYSTDTQGIIVASRDGRIWEQVYTGEKFDDTPTARGSSVFGVVWDGSHFWAGAHESNNGPGPDDVYEVDILLSSDDGFRWTEAGRVNIPFAEWPEGYLTGLLVPHCSEAVKDDNGNAVPDGIYGKKDALLIRPSTIQAIDYMFGGTGLGTFATTVMVNERPVEVGIPVVCVANAGDVWLAGGGTMAEGVSAQSAFSIDDGETWTKLETPGVSAMIDCIVGRPL